MEIAEAGIEKLGECVDSLVVIPNERLKQVSETRITFLNAFVIADDVLRQGIQSISELINVTGLVNLDFADVTAIMSDAGNAHMGVGQAQGKDKAEQAALLAISSPLLETSIKGARGIIVNITASPDIGLDEVDIAASMISKEAHPDAQIIWGAAFDENLEDAMKVTVIATGFDSAKKSSQAFAKPAVETAPAAPVSDIDEKSGLFRNEYVEENVDETDLGDGISDSDFDDILSLFKKD